MAGLKHTRVGRIPDLARMAKALQRPGNDPRIWSSLAVVTGVKLDPAEGVFVAITLLPSRLQEVARLGTEYAGPGWGLYSPIYEGDEVLVEAPSGHPDEGIVVVRRLHSKSDKPPDQAVANPDDVVFVIKPGQSFRLFTSASATAALGDGAFDLAGKWIVTAGTGVEVEATTGDAKVSAKAGVARVLGLTSAVVDAAQVLLGGEALAIHPFLKSNIYRPAEDAFFAAVTAAVGVICGGLGAAGGSLSAAGADPLFAGSAPAAAALVASAGASLTAAAAAVVALTTAQATFLAGLASYLSTKVRGE